MPRSLLLLVPFLLSLLACGSDSAPPSGRGAVGRGREGEATYAPPTATVSFEPPRRRIAPSEMPPAPPSSPPPPAPLAAPREPSRDLAAELAAAVGDPSGCLTNLPAEVRSATIFVSATVFEDGVLSSVRASVSSGTADANRCVQRMAESARLAGGVPNAPRPISTQLEVHR